MPCFCLFSYAVLIIYLNAIETLICRREMSLTGSTSFGFAQNTIHDCQNTVLTSQWHCLRQMSEKKCLFFFKLLFYLTLYHTIPTFNDPKKKPFENIVGKEEKCW